MNVIFETDLPTTLKGRAIRSMFVTDINGSFVPRGDGRWLMAVQYMPERGERPEDFTVEHCRGLIRRGAGRSDLRVEIIDTRPWEAAAAVADRYVDRRVFLVGDSAHVMPPTGGFGGNTGIQDANNLAWKLDAVIRGAAGPRLLDSYDAERRPVADATMAQSLARLQAWCKDPGRKLPPAAPIVEDAAVIFGYRYASGAFVNDHDDDSPDLFENPRAPSAQPGSRAPQIVVEHEGRRVSTVDLFSGRWVLLAGPEGSRWRDATLRSPAAAALGLDCHFVGSSGDLQDVARRWSPVFGAADGAVLVRPDGFIAWRSERPAKDAGAAVERALESLDIDVRVNR